MEASPRLHTAPPAGKKTSVVLLLIALALLFCMVVLSLAAAVFLYVTGNNAKADLSSRLESATNEIAVLKRNASGLENRLLAQETEKAALESRVNTLADVDIAAIRGDITLLKDAAKDVNPGFYVSNLNLTFSDTDTNYDYYYGNATVTCGDNSAGYVVIIKQTWISGGTANRDTVQYFLIPVAGGTGKFYTTDWNDKGKLVKPSYNYEVVGFVKTTPGK